MPTEFRAEVEIDRIANGLLDRSLPKREWTHTAHFAAALWLLRHRGAPVVTAHMPQWIRVYNVATGVANTETTGYHHTITLASLRAARAVLAVRDANEPVYVVVNDLMAGDLGRPDWLLRYWSRSRLFSPEARAGWQDPDLAPFPY